MEEGQKDSTDVEAEDADSEGIASGLNESIPLNIPESGDNEDENYGIRTQSQQSTPTVPPERASKRKVQRKKGKGRERTGYDLPNPTSVAVVREVYDGEHAHEFFERELEWALEAGAPAIVVEPSRLGDETARWIAVGNCLHKGGVIAGAASLIAGTLWPSRPVLYIPSCICSALCTSLYMFSWCPDPCCKYQVETDPRQLANILPLHLLSTSSTPPGWVGRHPHDGPPSSSSSSSSSSSMHRFPTSTSPVVLVRKDDSRRKVLHSTVALCAILLCAYRLYYSRK
ncbi:transmembrane protein 11, mitochondrial [Ischnura elegans]|uniref:transmembrane protein 11, mitochondrial n=1 Tax=Ischnura elegans TaxID=197161 RepID=UPI001ED894BC|nr:transmembrane protein 11, mitochondrial [Ischnura elegans]XP_046398930.1 transmembrane protein 11, mitochondrial [Ischnura elegans]